MLRQLVFQQLFYKNTVHAGGPALSTGGSWTKLMPCMLSNAGGSAHTPTHPRTPSRLDDVQAWSACPLACKCSYVQWRCGTARALRSPPSQQPPPTVAVNLLMGAREARLDGKKVRILFICSSAAWGRLICLRLCCITASAHLR